MTASGAPSWDFAASLYLWLPSKRGVINGDNFAIPLDDPDDSAGAFLYMEGERGRMGFIADLDLLTSTDRVDSLGGTIEVEEETVIGELDATYRPNPESALQFIAGLRVLDTTQDIRLPVLGDRTSSVTKVDPIIGAQATWTLGEPFFFRLRGDIGGFGIDSDFTYQTFGVFGWEFVRRWRLTAGYRMVGWEFEEDGIRNDLRLSGPLLGLAASF